MPSCVQIVQSDTFHARTHGQIMPSDGKVVQSCTFHARIVKLELCKVNVLCIVYSVIDRCGCVQRGGHISMCLRARACVCVRACVLNLFITRYGNVLAPGSAPDVARYEPVVQRLRDVAQWSCSNARAQDREEAQETCTTWQNSSMSAG
jgi:hypothetical protein